MDHVLFAQIIFAPRIAGVYVAQLSLSCGPVDRSIPVAGRLPVMVTLQAVAENPSVEVHVCYFSDFYFRNFGRVLFLTPLSFCVSEQDS